MTSTQTKVRKQAALAELPEYQIIYAPAGRQESGKVCTRGAFRFAALPLDLRPCAAKYILSTERRCTGLFASRRPSFPQVSILLNIRLSS